MSIPQVIPSNPIEGSLQTSDSVSSSPDVFLAANTIAMLDSFLAEKAAEQSLFRELEERALHEDTELDSSEGSSTSTGKRGLSVDEFRTAFAEDWQLSQFWYTTPFAHRLAEAVHSVVPAPTERSNIAYICSPTGYVASQNLHQSGTTLLLEYDQRFEVAAKSSGGGHFVSYDLEEESIPEGIKGTVELAIVDPPFLNEVTNRHLAETLKQLLHPTKGKLVLITSTSVTCLSEVYGEVPQLGHLRMSKLQPEHVGLRNDFACWTTWEGGEYFGSD